MTQLFYLPKEVGISHSIFEGDSQHVINTLHSSDTSHSSFSHLIKDIIFLASSLQNYYFSYFNKKGNAV